MLAQITAAMLFAALPLTPADDARPADGEAVSEAQAEPQAGRRVFRKMHVIRPDLLPYPVMFEYYC